MRSWKNYECLFRSSIEIPRTKSPNAHEYVRKKEAAAAVVTTTVAGARPCTAESCTTIRLLHANLQLLQTNVIKSDPSIITCLSIPNIIASKDCSKQHPLQPTAAPKGTKPSLAFASFHQPGTERQKKTVPQAVFTLCPSFTAPGTHYHV